MYCYKGKQIDVWADNDGGLWYYDERGNAQTVEEEDHGMDRTEGQNATRRVAGPVRSVRHGNR